MAIVTEILVAGALVGATPLSITAHTVDASLSTSTAVQAPTLHMNGGAGADVNLTLPPCAVGLHYRGYVSNGSFYLKFTAASGDEIQFDITTSALAGFMRSTAKGSYVDFEGLDSTTWLVTHFTGIWTVDE